VNDGAPRGSYTALGVGRARKLLIGSVAAALALLALSTSSVASGSPSEAPVTLSGASVALTAASGARAPWVGWGSDVGGALGVGYGSFTPALTPVALMVAAPTELVAGHAALMPDGTVRAWGFNSAGQIGDGTRQRKLNPITVPGLTGVTQIAGYGEHMIALLSDGTVKTWGANLSGQLGTGTIALPHGEGCLTGCRSLVPISVPGLAGVVAVFAGGADDAALLKTGAVMAWGENRGGQLGDGTTVEKDVPTLVRGLAGVRTLALGGLYTLGGHMLALLNDGTVDAVGSNPQGQLGTGSTVSSSFPVKVRGLAGVTAISTSWTHSLALADGKLLAWGDDTNGELGVHTSTLCGVFLSRPCATTPAVVPLEGVSSIAAGYAASDVAAGGRAYSTGRNNFGQLGNGTKIDRSTFGPVSGLAGVLKVQADEVSGFAEIGGSASSPIIEAIPGADTLTVNWRASGGTGWIITSRPFTGAVRRSAPFGAKTELPALTRSYTLTGTPGQTYEVSVMQQQGSFGRNVVEGTPSL
jgi:alpha-tubulin suppressor-like RCC1 family protein